MKISQTLMVALFGFSTAFAPTYSTAQETPQGFAFAEVPSADGALIGYLTAGSGPPVVIVHGALDTGDSWPPCSGCARTRSEELLC
jgi:hypothetical protein